MSGAGLFRRVLAGEPSAVPPIWLMRQAGRYHAPYQRLRARHSFEELCRVPELAAEVALGPVLDFDFDAAILFSDLLFPLEAFGLSLSYADGPPKLHPRLTAEVLSAFRPLEDAAPRVAFQRDALAATRARLDGSKGLIGFVGGPWTLFVYAIEGTHAGPLARAKAEMDLYRAFAARMVPLLIETIRLQFDGGADVVMLFDTAAGELTPDAFREYAAPDLAVLAGKFPHRLGYYAKGAGPAHLETPAFAAMPWQGIGLDWHWDLAKVLATPRNGRFVQGNFDPQSLLLPHAQLAEHLAAFVEPLRALTPDARRGWVCGLGHGVLQHTPEASVRTFVHTIRESFA